MTESIKSTEELKQDSPKKLIDYLKEDLEEYGQMNGCYDSAAIYEYLKRLFKEIESGNVTVVKQDMWKGIALESQARVEGQQREIQRSYEIIKGLEEENAAMKEVLEKLDAYLDFSEEIADNESIGEYENASGINKAFRKAHSFLSTLSKEDTQ